MSNMSCEKLLSFSFLSVLFFISDTVLKREIASSYNIFMRSMFMFSNSCMEKDFAFFFLLYGWGIID